MTVATSYATQHSDQSEREELTSRLSEALFVPQERWGWEFIDPGPPGLSPLRDRPPVWTEPTAPATSSADRRPSIPAGKVIKRVVVLVLLFFLTLSFPPGARALVVVPVGMALLWIGPSVIASIERDSAQRRFERQRALERRDYDGAVQRWHERISRDESAEWSRVNSVDLWFPVRLQSLVDRIDVFGGAPHGWPHLLATFAATPIADSTKMLILDLTDHDVAYGLTELARRETTTRRIQLPRDVDKVDLLEGLGPEEVADVLAEALETMRPAPDATLRALDAELLAGVAEQLDGRLSAAKLRAGLGVIQRTYESDGVLSVDEVSRLTPQVDSIGSGERVHDELRFIRGALALLVQRTSEAAEGDMAPLWGLDTLTVIATGDRSQRRKDFVDRVLFHAVLQRLRSAQTAGHIQVLVVAGADHLGAASLESLSRQATRRGVRLVYMFEHLRDDTQRILGGSHSASIIMRLGNGQEAAAAAEFIGRGYSMKLSQLTRQSGITDSVGGGSSVSESISSSDTQGSSRGAQSSTSSSYAQSISTSYQTMSNWSRATSTTDGVTEQRSYEFSVEPTMIQSLPPTAFVLVEGGPNGRRSVIGDCNPAIALLDKVSPSPRPATA